MNNDDADPSLGWNAVANEFVVLRSESGSELIRRWATRLPPKSAILDVGCGHGVPVTQTLINSGHSLFAIDAAPAMVKAFRERFPHVPIRCEPAETSLFFERRFDAVIAVGLIFLLPEDRQPGMITRLGDALLPGGRLLISAPRQVGGWNDTLTQRPSYSLGFERYSQILGDAGIVSIESLYDEAGSHYYAGLKERADRRAPP